MNNKPKFCYRTENLKTNYSTYIFSVASIVIKFSFTYTSFTCFLYITDPFGGGSKEV